ncbi:hypothetical protein BDV30DRAFT_163014 [Aspergillus minisclerotigenes]|uniref:Uncharacterized protein n=1 Tax=Aspergillus minisclerotigenes TaxID=656917 RepID=A0A5N6IWA5_9EURO|nr:hypothetical protein BDV30DRAFT_163014 [Aspergillus minisclerotigenes]
MSDTAKEHHHCPVWQMPLMKEGWRRGSESVSEEAIDESELQCIGLVSRPNISALRRMVDSVGPLDGAQPGDLVCVFDGATVPYMLRPRARE